METASASFSIVPTDQRAGHFSRCARFGHILFAAPLCVNIPVGPEKDAAGTQNLAISADDGERLIRVRANLCITTF